MDWMDKMDKMDRVDNVDRVDRVDRVDKVDQVDRVDNVDQVDGVDKRYCALKSKLIFILNLFYHLRESIQGQSGIFYIEGIDFGYQFCGPVFQL